jgi:hypothetical protein
LIWLLSDFQTADFWLDSFGPFWDLRQLEGTFRKVGLSGHPETGFCWYKINLECSSIYIYFHLENVGCSTSFILNL